MEDSESSVLLSSLVRSFPSSSSSMEQAGASTSSSSNNSFGSSGIVRMNLPHRYGARIQTRIPGVSVHSCVARIRAENQYLAEDIVEGAAIDRAVVSQLASHVNEIMLHSPKRSNPSPLGSSARRSSPLVMLQC